MSTIDFGALKKWNAIGEYARKMILKNVFCSNCSVTTITDYSISQDKYGIILQGKCKKCGNDVARYVEND